MEKVQISDLTLTVGMRFGLDGATASCRWSGLSPQALDQETVERFRQNVVQLCVPHSFFGVENLAWPVDLLVDRSYEDSLAAWGVALTVLFQRFARDPVGFGTVAHVDAKSAKVAVPWEREQVLKGAMQLALQHLLSWMQPAQRSQVQISQLQTNLQKWLASVQLGGLSPNSLRFALAARQRSIPVQVMNGVLRLGWGALAERMDSSFTGRTGNVAARVARNKLATNRVLHEGGIPVPACAIVSDYPTAVTLAQRLGWPVVVKPSNQDQGKGVIPGIEDEATLKRAFDAAVIFSPGAVIVEEHVYGNDYRMLVVGGRLQMAIHRVPGGVTGDGQRSIVQLIEEVNRDPLRGENVRSMMIWLKLDDESRDCLAGQGLTPDAIPSVGRFVALRRTANISTGGTALDVSHRVHPDNRLMAERAARLVGLDIAGVDFLCPDISRSWRAVGGAICEVNAQPGFRVHWLGNPTRDINGEIIDWLFQGRPSRIPTAAISGTKEKNTTALMLHHIWMQTGACTGVCTTNGVWVGNDQITDKSLPAFAGVRMMLNDPVVEAAVIELPHKDLQTLGHPCDEYDVVAVMNEPDDAIGTDGVAARDGMARTQAEALARARHAIVIHADDNQCLALLSEADTRHHILVAQSQNDPAIRHHLIEGKRAVFIADSLGKRWVVFADGLRQTPVVPLRANFLTLDARLVNDESSALFAAAIAWAQGIDTESIAEGLKSFAGLVENGPMR